jgi:polysaccharide biosynthesis/export protein
MRTLTLVLLCSLAAAQDRLPAPLPAAGGNLPARPIRPNDLLSVTVYGAPELTRTVRVSSSGLVRMPLVHREIEALGAMPEQVETRIAEALAAEDILVDPSVVVSIAEYETRPISVAGAVRRPVTFLIYEKTSLLEALTRAEGLAADAGTQILVTRPAVEPDQAPRVERIPVKGLIDNADPALNLTLEGGEEVRVPEIGRVFVVGNVHKPGAFRIEDPSGLSVLKGLALAEGLIPFASKQAYIYRRGDAAPGAAPKEMVVELRRILDRKSPDLDLGPGDILYIPDNRAAHLTAGAIEKAIGFAAGTASGALILGVNH